MSTDKNDAVSLEERTARVRADLEQIKFEVIETCWSCLLTGSDERYGRAKAAFYYLLHEYEDITTTDPESCLLVRECIYEITKSRAWGDIMEASKVYADLVAADAAENAAHAAKKAMADEIAKIHDKYCTTAAQQAETGSSDNGAASADNANRLQPRRVSSPTSTNNMKGSV